MFMFFLLVSACNVIFLITLRILQTKTAGTDIGAALAYIH